MELTELTAQKHSEGERHPGEMKSTCQLLIQDRIRLNDAESQRFRGIKFHETCNALIFFLVGWSPRLFIVVAFQKSSFVLQDVTHLST